jgi:hypothetical protein
MAQESPWIPVVIAALIVCAYALLRLTYNDQRSKMTPAERAAEDKALDADQIW